MEITVKLYAVIALLSLYGFCQVLACTDWLLLCGRCVVVYALTSLLTVVYALTSLLTVVYALTSLLTVVYALTEVNAYTTTQRPHNRSQSAHAKT